MRWAGSLTRRHAPHSDPLPVFLRTPFGLVLAIGGLFLSVVAFLRL